MIRKTTGLWMIALALLLAACQPAGQPASPTLEATLPPPTTEPTSAPTETVAPPTAEPTTVATPPVEATATTEAPVAGTLDEFIASFQSAVAARDIAALQGMMADPFAFGFWLSEGIQMSPAEAAAEIESFYLPEGAQIAWADPDTDLAPLLQGQPPATFLGPDRQVVATLLSYGWGEEGDDEAIHFITQRPDGGYQWELWLHSGFGFPGVGPVESSAVVIVADEATFYAGPGTQYEPVATVFGGTTYPVIDASPDGAWMRLTCYDDANEIIPWCWVSADPAVTAPTELP